MKWSLMCCHLMCGVVFGNPYMYLRDAIFIRRGNLYCLVKDGKDFIINAHKDKSKISLVSANQAMKLISSSRKFVLLFMRQNREGDELVEVKASVDVCTKEYKHQLDKLLQAYEEVFQELEGCHLKGKWSTYNYCLTLHFQT